MTRGIYSLVAVHGVLVVGASLIVEQSLEHAGFSSCGAQASLPLGMWNLPGLRMEPCISRQILNNRTPREVPLNTF